jgi:hypothetical protein
VLDISPRRHLESVGSRYRSLTPYLEFGWDDDFPRAPPPTPTEDALRDRGQIDMWENGGTEDGEDNSDSWSLVVNFESEEEEVVLRLEESVEFHEHDFAMDLSQISSVA